MTERPHSFLHEIIYAPLICHDSIDFSLATAYKTLKTVTIQYMFGPDGLPNVFLKQFSGALAVPFSHILDILV